eukprot:744898-Pelagomonas_calceolata.AAC.8
MHVRVNCTSLGEQEPWRISVKESRIPGEIDEGAPLSTCNPCPQFAALVCQKVPQQHGSASALLPPDTLNLCPYTQAWCWNAHAREHTKHTHIRRHPHVAILVHEAGLEDAKHDLIQCTVGGRAHQQVGFGSRVTAHARNALWL